MRRWPAVIARAEVLAGFSVPTERLARDLLDRFRTLPITTDVADLAASLRRKEHWKLPDAPQAALAIRHELTLVTCNTRDFSSSRKMPVLVPYRCDACLTFYRAHNRIQPERPIFNCFYAHLIHMHAVVGASVVLSNRNRH